MEQNTTQTQDQAQNQTKNNNKANTNKIIIALIIASLIGFVGYYLLKPNNKGASNQATNNTNINQPGQNNQTPNQPQKSIYDLTPIDELLAQAKSVQDNTSTHKISGPLLSKFKNDSCNNYVDVDYDKVTVTLKPGVKEEQLDFIGFNQEQDKRQIELAKQTLTEQELEARPENLKTVQRLSVELLLKGDKNLSEFTLEETEFNAINKDIFKVIPRKDRNGNDSKFGFIGWPIRTKDYKYIATHVSNAIIPSIYDRKLYENLSTQSALEINRVSYGGVQGAILPFVNYEWYTGYDETITFPGVDAYYINNDNLDRYRFNRNGNQLFYINQAAQTGQSGTGLPEPSENKIVENYIKYITQNYFTPKGLNSNANCSHIYKFIKLYGEYKKNCIGENAKIWECGNMMYDYKNIEKEL
jgi:hypothetical protein